jgi:signal transduction histidine kinase
VDKSKNTNKEISRLKKSLKEAESIIADLQRQEVLKEILPVVFHKLKNKLTPIMGYAQILLARTDEEKTRERLIKIERNADELTELLNQLREYFGTIKHRKRKGNLNQILADLKPYFLEVQKKHKVKIEVETDPAIQDSYYVSGQIEFLIRAMVENSLNGIKAKKRQKGVIRIRTDGENGHSRLCIRDNGMGMSEQDLRNIWMPFYSKFAGHTGLGLSICERVIVNHQARVEVKSRDGEFSEFIITFTDSGDEIDARKQDKTDSEKVKKS